MRVRMECRNCEESWVMHERLEKLSCPHCRQYLTLEEPDEMPRPSREPLLVQLDAVLRTRKQLP